MIKYTVSLFTNTNPLIKTPANFQVFSIKIFLLFQMFTVVLLSCLQVFTHLPKPLNQMCKKKTQLIYFLFFTQAGIPTKAEDCIQHFVTVFACQSQVN